MQLVLFLCKEPPRTTLYYGIVQVANQTTPPALILGNQKQTSHKKYRTRIFFKMLRHMQKISHSWVQMKKQSKCQSPSIIIIIMTVPPYS